MKKTLLLLPFLLLSGFVRAAPADPLAQALQDFVEARASSLPGKVGLEPGRYPAESEKFKACRQWEVFLPERANLWGRVSLGARCTRGPAQSLYVPVVIRIEGRAILAARHIASGETIQNSDLQIVDTDLGSLPPDVILAGSNVAGRVARSAIPPGRPLREGLLRQENMIEAGQPVRVVLQDGVLSVSNEGVAISSAARGQTARVRLPDGRILSGTASEPGRIDVRP